MPTRPPAEPPVGRASPPLLRPCLPVGALLPPLLILAFLVGGCGTLPPPQEPTPLPAVDPKLTWARFHADRQQRLARLHDWQVVGVLEVSNEQGKRRYRTEIQGQATQRAKVTLLGLLQQVVAILLAGPEEIRLVDADKQQIVEVPASAAGLDYLLGLPLQPDELFESLLGLADALSEAESGLPHGWWSRQGELLVLEPGRGLIQERSGQTEAGGSYRVVYQWPAAEAGETLPMPTQVHVTLLPSGAQVKYTARQWQLPGHPWAADWFALPASSAGFVVERPLQARPVPE
ncbi:MAG: hypothetical protein HQL88_01620 [Magnetococcales bacterium]|nr:hypothetical protein [Magnetococcales bacterium]